jgi:hypothetical protein
MLCPLRLRWNLKIASKVLLVVCAARLTKKVTPTVWCTPAVHKNRGSNPLNTAQRTLSTGRAAKAAAEGQRKQSTDDRDGRNVKKPTRMRISGATLDDREAMCETRKQDADGNARATKHTTIGPTMDATNRIKMPPSMASIEITAVNQPKSKPNRIANSV